MQEILEKAAALKRLRQSKDELKQGLDELNEQITQAEQEVVDQMLGSQVQSFNYAGDTFYLSYRQYASLVQQPQQRFFNRLRRHSLAEIIKPTIPKQVLNAFVREQLEQNNGQLPHWMTPFVSVNYRTVLGVRKQKST